jgi:hypothetical protein
MSIILILCERIYKKNEMQGFNLSLTLKVRALNRKEIIKNNEQGNMDYIYI